MLIVLGLSMGLVVALVHDREFGIWFDKKWAAYNGGAPAYAGVYLDSEDRLTLEDLPRLDCSGGGVYFFGSSNMKWATRLPDMPEDIRSMVHNCGAAEGSPYYIRQFVEYLAKHKNLLQAGADKTLVVYGTGLLNMRPGMDDPNQLFNNMWRRHGLYTYDFNGGIEPAEISPWLRPYVLEKARAASFVQALIDRGGRMMVPKALLRRSTSKDQAAYIESYKGRLGKVWRKNLELHRLELQALADYLRAEKIEFAIVLLPLASWHYQMPYTMPYCDMIRDVCKRNPQVRLIDFSHLLSDEEFFDHIHANDQGLDKLNSKLMDIAKGFLSH
jgi:hypothetical protein